jgi:hypothetical protein
MEKRGKNLLGNMSVVDMIDRGFRVFIAVSFSIGFILLFIVLGWYVH